MSSDIKPKLRDGALYTMRDAMIDALKKTFDIGLGTTCLTCIAFNEQMELCNKYKARPPARVIAYGCPAYFNDDEIPF